MVCSFPPHPTFWPHVKLPYFLVPRQPFWSSHWTQKVHPEARTLLLLFTCPGVLSLFPLVSTCLAHFFHSSKCLLLTFYQGGLFWPLYQKKTPNTEPSYLLSSLHCSSWYLSPFKILYLLNYWLIVSFNSPFTLRLLLPASCFLTLWDTFISVTKPLVAPGYPSRKSLSSSVVTV